ncbi:MAG: Fibronectin/fibrinogen-binding protein [uncultured Campylobacterales bacterium]|uniref:Fibronectin/fibrinogen-binding protein n=1 Tax=uncultured Campylobacterales bacterium TaxID=352960 RepID=A0A6S6S725_9BACT|nr:MAG: Fibronectin/fibrinogen-binding protein [uncultured Campylobacterales bacterium]
MKYNTFYNIIKNLKTYKYITLVKRVKENLLLIVFDNRDYIYFDVTKGNSNIFSTKNALELDTFNASFDITLKKLFSKVSIKNIDIVNSDKILKIDIEKKSSYKTEIYSLQIELTSRFTNVIVLDSEKRVVNALRFVKDSIRNILKDEVLVDSINVPSFKYEETNIPDIMSYLEDRFQDLEKNKLNSLKKSKEVTLKNQIKKLQNSLSKLKDEEELINESNELYTKANELLTNINTTSNIHNEPLSKTINDMFTRAKKLKQKAKNINIEFSNLAEKIEFLNKKIILLNNITKLDKFYLLFKTRKNSNNKDNKNQNIESIFYKGLKISYGKNSAGNEYLLKSSKANDIWMHLQGLPSTHVILHTNKTNVPEDVLELGANLCVEYSVQTAGDYIVDYTKRKFVKIVDGSFTNYTNQKSIHMLKDELANPFL